MLSHLSGLRLNSHGCRFRIEFFARQILQNTAARDVICVDNGYEADVTERMQGKMLAVRSVDRADADLMVMMDVLEHIEDDAAFLHGYATMARSGSSLCHRAGFSVPVERSRCVS